MVTTPGSCAKATLKKNRPNANRITQNRGSFTGGGYRSAKQIGMVMDGFNDID